MYSILYTPILVCMCCGLHKAYFSKIIYFRYCNHTHKLFSTIFPESEIAKKMTLCRTKASDSITDGLSDLIREGICKEVQDANASFTLLFDKTTTNFDRKHMDLLIRFFSEKAAVVVRKHLTCFFFGHATGEDLCKYFDNFIADFKGISTLPLDVNQLAFDLHAWFKQQPCKKRRFLTPCKRLRPVNIF